MKFCAKCGKELNEYAVICIGCGCPVENQSSDSYCVVNDVPQKATTAMILGILSVVIFAPLGILSIVFANQSKNETNGVMCTQAKAGLICGIIGLCIWGLAIIALL